MVANCNYALTPYSREAGALAMVPRSHLKQRQPSAHENWTAGGETMAEITARNPAPNDLDTIDWELPHGAVTMNINPGDAVIWHGNTWHGGWPRTARRAHEPGDLYVPPAHASAGTPS